MTFPLHLKSQNSMSCRESLPTSKVLNIPATIPIAPESCDLTQSLSGTPGRDPSSCIGVLQSPTMQLRSTIPVQFPRQELQGSFQPSLNVPTPHEPQAREDLRLDSGAVPSSARIGALAVLKLPANDFNRLWCDKRDGKHVLF